MVGLPDEMQSCLNALDAAAVRRLSRSHRDGLQAILQRDRGEAASERIVDKMPDNYLYLGLLTLMSPRRPSSTSAAMCATWPCRAG